MPNVSHVVVEGAGHAIRVDDPPAVLVAVRRLLPPSKALATPCRSPNVTAEPAAGGAAEMTLERACIAWVVNHGWDVA